MRLRDRYTLALVALTTVVAVLVGGAMLYQTAKVTSAVHESSGRVMRNALYAQLENHGRGMAAHLATNLTNPLYNLDMAAIYDLARSARSQDAIFYAFVTDSQGKILHDGTKELLGYGRKVDDPATLGALTTNKVSVYRDDKVLIAAAPIRSASNIIGAVTVAIELDRVNKDIAALQSDLDSIDEAYWRALLITAMTLAAGLLVLAWALSAGVARNLTRPIDLLSQLTARIGRRNYDFELPFERSDEMGDLAKAFWNMAQDIKGTTVSKDYLESVLENMLDPLLVFRTDGTLETANAKAKELLGLDSNAGPEGGDMSSYSAGALVRRGEEGEEAFDIRDVLESGRLESVEGVLVSRDGTMVPALISSSVMRGGAGEEDRILLVGRDISEHKEFERKLRQSQKMEAVGQLTGGVAHDFNNLLAVIQGNAELLVERFGRSSTRELDAIERAAGRGAELTDRLLAFSRRQALVPQVTDIGDLVDGLCSMLSRTLGENMEIDLVRKSGSALVSLDQGQLENAILNLAINARDAMPDGGCIRIETGSMELQSGERAERMDLQPGLYAYLSITDTGTGIAPEVLPQVFEPFFTTKQAGLGSGLGLSMVYGFTKQSDGGIEIESTPGKGTTVRLLFPAAEGEAPEEDIGREVATIKGGGQTVLIVEDDADVRDFVCASVGRLGYEVLVAENAQGALNGADCLARADVILTDIVLKDAMSGPQLAEEALRRKPDLKVVFMSGYPDNEFPKDLISLQSAGFLAKPFTTQQLSSALHAALDQA